MGELGRHEHHVDALGGDKEREGAQRADLRPAPPPMCARSSAAWRRSVCAACTACRRRNARPRSLAWLEQLQGMLARIRGHGGFDIHARRGLLQTEAPRTSDGATTGRATSRMNPRNNARINVSHTADLSIVLVPCVSLGPESLAVQMLFNLHRHRQGVPAGVRDDHEVDAAWLRLPLPGSTGIGPAPGSIRRGCAS